MRGGAVEWENGSPTLGAGNGSPLEVPKRSAADLIFALLDVLLWTMVGLAKELTLCALLQNKSAADDDDDDDENNDADDDDDDDDDDAGGGSLETKGLTRGFVV